MIRGPHGGATVLLGSAFLVYSVNEIHEQNSPKYFALPKPAGVKITRMKLSIPERDTNRVVEAKFEAATGTNPRQHLYEEKKSFDIAALKAATTRRGCLQIVQYG